MAYSTPEMVRQALVPSGDGSLPAAPSNTAADLGDAQLNDAIAEADALINGYLAKFYTVPVAEVAGVIPAPVNYWSRDLAAYNASLAYRGSLDFTDNDPVARRYKAVIDALKAIAKGDMKLDLPTSGGTDSPAAAGSGSAINPYEGELFTPDDFGVGSGPDDGSAQAVFWRSPYWGL